MRIPLTSRTISSPIGELVTLGTCLGTRAFQSGDSLRQVHWTQTARQQQMIICGRQAPATTSVRVILDVDSASHPDVVPHERNLMNSLELAVEVAASVCESLHKQHCRLELSLNDQLFVSGDSAQSFQRLTDSLSQAELSNEKKQFIRRQDSQSFNILITTQQRIPANGCSRSGQHVIGVSNDLASTATSSYGSSISLGTSSDADVELQR